MNIKIKIWHFLLCFWLLILVIRFDFIIDIYSLLFSFIVLLTADFHNAITQLNFSLADTFASGLLFIIIPVSIYSFRRRLRFINDKLTFSNLILMILFICFISAPLITNRNPDFQKNIGVTRLLPPFSSVKALNLKEKINYEQDNRLAGFVEKRNKVVKRSFDETVIFVDSIALSDLNSEQLVYFQKETGREISKEELKIRDDKRVISNWFYLFGTDQYGRDVFARLVYGARISLFVGIASVLISFIIGVGLGFLSGYFGGIPDIIFSRIADMFLAFPAIFLVVLILAFFGNTLLSVIIVLGFSGWMSLFKIVKTEVVSVKIKDYFISARMLGLSKGQLLLKEILPVIIVPVVVNLVFQYGNVILAESALSYLGLGTGINYSSWGSMIESGQEYLSTAWWMIFFPGITLILTLLTANNFGNELNSKLNPKLHYD